MFAPKEFMVETATAPWIATLRLRSGHPATKLQNSGFEVDFAMPWAQGHGGDYDLEELFAWMDRICR